MAGGSAGGAPPPPPPRPARSPQPEARPTLLTPRQTPTPRRRPDAFPETGVSSQRVDASTNRNPFHSCARSNNVILLPMKLLLIFALAATLAALSGTPVAAADPPKVLFEENFSGQLGP